MNYLEFGTVEKETKLYFALYDQIKAKIDKEKNLTQKKKKDLLVGIKQLDDDGHELVFAIIKYHCMVNDIPIPVKSGDLNRISNVEFDMKEIDEILIKIIKHAVDIHTNSQQEKIVLDQPPLNKKKTVFF